MNCEINGPRCSNVHLHVLCPGQSTRCSEFWFRSPKNLKVITNSTRKNRSHFFWMVPPQKKNHQFFRCSFTGAVPKHWALRQFFRPCWMAFLSSTAPKSSPSKTCKCQKRLRWLGLRGDWENTHMCMYICKCMLENM